MTGPRWLRRLLAWWRHPQTIEPGQTTTEQMRALFAAEDRRRHRVEGLDRAKYDAWTAKKRKPQGECPESNTPRGD